MVTRLNQLGERIIKHTENLEESLQNIQDQQTTLKKLLTEVDRVKTEAPENETIIKNLNTKIDNLISNIRVMTAKILQREEILEKMEGIRTMLAREIEDEPVIKSKDWDKVNKEIEKNSDYWGLEIDNPNIARERYIKSKQTQLTEIVDVTFTKVEESIKKMEPVEGLTKRLNDYLSHNLRKNKSGIKTNGESVSEEDWKRNDTFKFLGSNDIYLNQPLAETHYDVQDSVGTLNLDKERVETEYARIKKALENNEQWISPLVSNLNQCTLSVAAAFLVTCTKFG